MKEFFRRHKALIVVVIAALLVGGYFIYRRLTTGAEPTRYVLAAAQKGSVVTTVSGTGQISASNQVDIKPKASGDVMTVAVSEGQQVKAGDLLAQLNARDAQKSLRDAQANLESAKLSLTKITQPASAYSLLQSENSLQSARDSLQKLRLSQPLDYQKAQNAKQQAADDLTKSYEDAFNSIANTFLNLPTIVTKLNDMLYSSEIAAADISLSNQWNIAALMNTTHQDNQLGLLSFQNSAESDYKTARGDYDANTLSYKNVSRYSDRAAIEEVLNQTLETVKAVAQAAKSQSNYFDAWVDYRSKHSQPTLAKVTAYQSNLSTYTGQINSSLSSLLAAQSVIQNDKDAVNDAQSALDQLDHNQPVDLAAARASVDERQSSLDQLRAGADPLDIQSQQLSIVQRQNAVADAYQQLADYSVKAPFAGKVVNLKVNKGDSLSSGAVLATLLTPQLMAEISLNEVDAAKIAAGQKATLTFDALPDLTITGVVGSVDAIGTVSQGVVTYNVKVALDTQDDKVKPGMSVSASIITAIKQDVLVVDNSAVKNAGSASYVEIPAAAVDNQTVAQSAANGIVLNQTPLRQTVQLGLANDTQTEIVSGLNEGQVIISRVISGVTAATAATGNNLFNFGGNRGGSFNGGNRAVIGR